jgi:hypothetical protein
MRITRSRDCGNSPKNQRAQDFAIALAAAKPSQLDPFLSPDVVWNRPATPPAKGSSAVLEALDSVGGATSIVVEHAITHGKAGAVSGTIKLRGGSPKGFCHIVEFADAKASRVRLIKTYLLEA